MVTGRKIVILANIQSSVRILEILFSKSKVKRWIDFLSKLNKLLKRTFNLVFLPLCFLSALPEIKMRGSKYPHIRKKYDLKLYTVRCQINVLTVKLKVKNNACFQHFHCYKYETKDLKH